MKEKYIVSDSFKDLAPYAKIEKIYQCALSKGCPVVIWSLPKSQEFHVIVGLSEKLHLGKVDLEKSNKGFILSAFSKKTSNEDYFLMADLYYSSSDNVLVIDPSIEPEKSVKLDAFIKSLELPISKDSIQSQSIPAANTNNYQSLVNQAVNSIKEGIYDKLVLSRNKKVKFHSEFDPIQKLIALRQAYLNAFCYLLSTHEFGNWMAATPETLVKLDENHFQTVALAGTQRLEQGTNLNEISWTQKEIEEQAMVSRYIINGFKKIRLREFEELGPKTIQAGNLAHLKTIFSVKYKEINFPELGTVMLDLLHPTSAVCGMPLEGATAFINKNEGFDRSLFTGYLGPVNIDHKTDIYVNLRAMQFNSHEALLYAGAGITADSNAEKEFLETEMKMNTLLNVIQ